jgi:hypothetical protein
LLSDVGLDEGETDALLKFYGEVQTLNRGLDLADTMRQSGDPEKINAEFGRNCLKAQQIAHPRGDFYSTALDVCEKRKSEPGMAILNKS